MKITDGLSDKQITEELCFRFKQYRISYPLTQKELADKAMVSVGTITRFENGKDIGLFNLIKLMKAMDVDKNLDMLIPDMTIRPSFFANESEVKQRYRRSKKTDSNWKWGDEE